MPESEPPKLYPDLELAADCHKVKQGSGDKTKLKETLKSDNAWLLWDRLNDLGLKLGRKNKELEKKAGEEIKELDEKLAAAKESGGETEIQEISFQKANILAKHGDFEASNVIYGEIKKEKKVSSGKKIEAGFGEARNMLFINEGIGNLMEEVRGSEEQNDELTTPSLVTKSARFASPVITGIILIPYRNPFCDSLRSLQVAEYCKLGGDWDKRNRHATYLALHNIRDREIEKAAEAMKAGVKTFNAEEVISFKEFCKLCTIASIVTASRSSLKKDIIDSPEVKAQLGNDEEGEIVLAVAKDFYDGSYDRYMRGILKLTSVMER